MKFTKRSLGDILKKGNSESSQVLRRKVEETEVKVGLPNIMAPRDYNNSQLSDASKIEDETNNPPMEKTTPFVPASCPIEHSGKMILNIIIPFDIDDLFTLLFTYNKFNMDLLETMKYTEVNLSEWKEDETSGLKTRIGHLVVPITQPVGPKTCQVTETQVMQSCSKPGELYVIEVKAVNAGVPYCDSFFICTHFCLTKVSTSKASFTVYAQIKYCKSVWGFIKTFIEKNVWSGLDDYFNTLEKAIQNESDKRMLESGVELAPCEDRENDELNNNEQQLYHTPASGTPPTTNAYQCTPITNNYKETVFWAIMGMITVLVPIIIVLFYKLTVFENFMKSFNLPQPIDSTILSEQRTHEQWVSLLQRLAAQHQQEVRQWKVTLKSVVSLLEQVEESISSLQSNIHTAIGEKVDTTLSSSSKDDAISIQEHNEL